MAAPDLVPRARARVLLCLVIAAGGVGAGTALAVQGAGAGAAGRTFGGVALAIGAVVIAVLLGAKALFALQVAARRREADDPGPTA